jgi:hypothetical protein
MLQRNFKIDILTILTALPGEVLHTSQAPGSGPSPMAKGKKPENSIEVPD